jgi:hypothetical protein
MHSGASLQSVFTVRDYVLPSPSRDRSPSLLVASLLARHQGSGVEKDYIVGASKKPPEAPNPPLSAEIVKI